MFQNRHLYSFIWVIFLWRLSKIKAYVDLCERPTSIYCNCEEPYRAKYKASCIILQNITESDPVWRSFGDAETIYHLKLQPMFPVALDYIPSELKRMPELKFLKIQEGILQILESYAVSNFKTLEELELDGNGIETLQPNAISNLPKLKTLTLSENGLQELLEGSFSDLLQLEILLLDRNNISRIETCTFCSLQNLKELELWGNQISDLTEYTFRGLRFLTRLDLSKNRIRILNDKVFHTLPRLSELDLRENIISHIAPRTFFGLEKLQSLTFSNNMVTILPDEVFLPLTDVRSVGLYQNQLEILQVEVIKNIKHSKDEHFSFSFKDNPFKCDCAMEWVATYQKITKSRWLIRELESVTCKLANESMKITDYLEITDCKNPAKKPKKSPALITSMMAKSTDSVPIELNSQKSKPLNRQKPSVVTATVTSLHDGTEEAYLSDVGNDKADSVVPDSGSELNSKTWITFFVAILTLCLSRSRLEM